MDIEELTVEVTHRCPLNCRFCSSKNSIYTTENHRLTPQEVKTYIDRFNPQKVRWSGGEPFTYLNQNYIKVAEDRRQVATSNGFYTKKILEKEKNLQEIRITVLGKQERHDRLCQRKNSWKRAVQTIKELIKRGRKPIVTSPLISEDQSAEVEEIAQRMGLECRIAGLVPVKDMERPEDVEKNHEHCSLGGEKCQRENKRLVLPNGQVLKCAVDKLNYECPNMIKEEY